MSVARRETLFGRIYRFFITVYFIMCAAMCIYYASIKDIYHLLISLGTLAAPPALKFLHRLLHLRRSYQLDMLIMGFVTLAYPLGACIDLYRRIPGFDKLAHGLSGVFVTVLCIILFVFLKPGCTLTPADIPLAITFAFFGSMAVAGMWELGEYIISPIVGLDLQRVGATGIADSMNDMLFCLAGTLMTLPVIPRLINGRDGVLASPIRAFTELNNGTAA